MPTRRMVTLALLLACAAGCAGEDPPVGDPPSPTPSATSGQGSPDPATRRRSAALADLATRTEAAPEQIRLVTEEQVVWRDGSLGCPEPGRAYTQALVEGYRLVFEVAGERYAYHGAEGDLLPRYCPDPRPDAVVDSG